jgi:hypothetical protein
MTVAVFHAAFLRMKWKGRRLGRVRQKLYHGEFAREVLKHKVKLHHVL